jgi:outer membrane receptor protein involved in Fe transport
VLHQEWPLARLSGHNVLGLDNFGTWIFSYRQQTGVGSPYSQFAGTLDLPTSPTNAGLIAHYRNNTVVDFRHNDYELAWTVQYLSGGNAVTPVVAPGFTGAAADYPGNRVGAVVYHALAAIWHHDNVALTLGANNLFDKKPPFWNDGTVNTNEFSYDVVGRFIYLNVKASLGDAPK